MIRRREDGVVGQHDPNDPSYLDFGDAASRTGLLAMCGSEQDMDLLPLFEDGNGFMRRDYVQMPWAWPMNSTRDQLIPYVSGCAFAGKGSIVRRLLDAHKARGWRCQNVDADAPGTTKKFPDGPDWLAPDHRMHLKLCADGTYKPSIAEILWLRASILWSCKVKPLHELNQIICQCIIAGPVYLRMLCKLHPDWKKNIREYWGGYPFRDQNEIGEMIIAKVDRCL